MNLREKMTQSCWRVGLWLVGLIGVWPSTIAQNVAAQSQADSSVRRQSGGWQPTVKALEVQTAYYQTQGNPAGGMPVLPSGGQGMPAGNEYWSAGQLPAFPGAGDMPRAVSPPMSMSDNLAPPRLPMPNRDQVSSYPAGDREADNRYSEQPSYSDRAIPGSAFPGSNATASQPRSSNGVPARLASTELRTIQNERDAGLRETGARPNGSGLLPNGRPAAESFTSGLPYVTPAPRGRYATSPYQPAVFQSSDQRSTLVPAQFASSSTVMPPTQGLRQTAPPGNLIATQAALPNFVGAAPPAYLTAQQAALPQYRYPQPGVYPTAYQCTPPAPSYPSTGAVPGAYVPPTLPPNLAPNLYTPNNAGYRPLFSLGQENYNVQLGRGIIGQPTAYVPGQYIRNFLRYLSP